MLTIEMLRQNAILTELSDAQLSAIAEMSKNDEHSVIGTRIGELHGQYDKDIFSVTGIKKNDGEKSYDYTKRVLNHYKASVEASGDLQNQLEKANTKVQELTRKIENGDGDTALRQQLKDTKNQVTQLQEQLASQSVEFVNAKAEYENSIKAVHADYAFAAATAGLKFKSGIPESVQKTMLGVAKAEIFAKGTPDFIENADGSKKLILRGADGNILNNVKNNLNPYTMDELVMETSLRDIIDTGRRQTGGGTKPNASEHNNSSSLIDLSGAKSQVEADRIITSHLLANGITRDSAEFSKQSMQLRAENNVASLPIR